MAAVWVLVLAATGIYLWWPRAIETGKPRLAVRWAKGGRIRWRDLHATTGILVSVVLIGYIVSGLTWSRYWGENWRAVAATLTPPTEIEAPSPGDGRRLRPARPPHRRGPTRRTRSTPRRRRGGVKTVDLQ